MSKYPLRLLRKALTGVAPFLVWLLVMGLIVFWVINIYRNAHNPFKYEGVKDFRFYADIVDEQSRIGKHYVEPVDVRTDSCGNNLGSLINNKPDGNCLKTVDVKKIFWPDGGYTTFNSCPMVAFNFDPQSCKATNGLHHTYDIVLFDKKPQ